MVNLYNVGWTASVCMVVGDDRTAFAIVFELAMAPLAIAIVAVCVGILVFACRLHFDSPLLFHLRLLLSGLLLLLLVQLVLVDFWCCGNNFWAIINVITHLFVNISTTTGAIKLILFSLDRSSNSLWSDALRFFLSHVLLTSPRRIHDSQNSG